MRSATLTAIIIACGLGPASAEGVTCKTFKTKLTAELKRTSPKMPALMVSEGRLTETTPHMTYGLSGVDGLSGNLECFDRDALREVDFLADMKSAPPKDSATRTGQLRILAAAATCAVADLPQARCAEMTSKLFTQVHREIDLKTAQHDPLPAADQYAEISSTAQLELSAMPGSMQVVIFIKPPPAP